MGRTATIVYASGLDALFLSWLLHSTHSLILPARFSLPSSLSFSRSLILYFYTVCILSMTIIHHGSYVSALDSSMTFVRFGYSRHYSDCLALPFYGTAISPCIDAAIMNQELPILYVHRRSVSCSQRIDGNRGEGRVEVTMARIYRGADNARTKSRLVDGSSM